MKSTEKFSLLRCEIDNLSDRFSVSQKEYDTSASLEDVRRATLSLIHLVSTLEERRARREKYYLIVALLMSLSFIALLFIK